MEISENFNSGLNINMNQTFSSDSSNSADIKDMSSVIKQPNEQMFKLLLSNANKSPSNSPIDNTPSPNIIHHQPPNLSSMHHQSTNQPLKLPQQPPQPTHLQIHHQIQPQIHHKMAPQMQSQMPQQMQSQMPQQMQSQMPPQMQSQIPQQMQSQIPQQMQSQIPQQMQSQIPQQIQPQHQMRNSTQMKQPVYQNVKQGIQQTTILPPTQQQMQSGGQQNNKKIVKFQENGEVNNVNNDANIIQSDNIDEFIKISNYNVHKHTIYLVGALIIIGIILWYITNDKKEEKEEENAKNKNKNKKNVIRK
jgi:hypothetical protein